MPDSLYRARLRAQQAVTQQRQAERARTAWKRGYLGDGAGVLQADRAQTYYVRLAGSDDQIVEARLASSTWVVMRGGVCVWLRPTRENGQSYYEIVGEAPGTDWTE